MRETSAEHAPRQRLAPHASARDYRRPQRQRTTPIARRRDGSALGAAELRRAILDVACEIDPSTGEAYLITALRQLRQEDYRAWLQVTLPWLKPNPRRRPRRKPSEPERSHMPLQRMVEQIARGLPRIG